MDRAEAIIMGGLVVAFLAGAPLAAIAAGHVAYSAGSRCYRPRYLDIQRLNYLWTIRHSSARIAGNMIT